MDLTPQFHARVFQRLYSRLRKTSYRICTNVNDLPHSWTFVVILASESLHSIFRTISSFGSNQTVSVEKYMFCNQLHINAAKSHYILCILIAAKSNYIKILCTLIRVRLTETRIMITVLPWADYQQDVFLQAPRSIAG